MSACGHGQNCTCSRTFIRPDRLVSRPAPPAPYGTTRRTRSPDPAKNSHEAFCALCGMGLMHRVKCANVELFGLAEPLGGFGQAGPLQGGLAALWPWIERSVERGDDGSMVSGWARIATGIELDPTTCTISESYQVHVPHSANTIHGQYIECTTGNLNVAIKPVRTVPIPPEFWDEGTSPPAGGLTEDLERLTYLMHHRCYEILQLVWVREKVPWVRRGGAGMDITTAASATSGNLNPGHLLPSLFAALHNLGHAPGKDYWSRKDCQFGSEVDFPGLVESWNASGCRRRARSATAAAARTAGKSVESYLGIVASRDMWPHLNPDDDRDEFCPGKDYTGVALVAVADPSQEIPYLKELLKFSPQGGGNTSIPPPTATSTTPIDPPRESNPPIEAPAQNTPTTRIAQHDPATTTTDPFARLPPELLLHILNYLSLPNISSFRLSSRIVASFIHPSLELPTSFFRNAFRAGGEFEFLRGLSIWSDATVFGWARPWDFTAIFEAAKGEGQGVDWRGLYRKVQYFLEANPKLEAGAEIFQEEGNNPEAEEEGNSPEAEEMREPGFGRISSPIVVPRNPALANRRRIWGVAERVVREMRMVMEDWREKRPGGAWHAGRRVRGGAPEGLDRPVEAGMQHVQY